MVLRAKTSLMQRDREYIFVKQENKMSATVEWLVATWSIDQCNASVTGQLHQTESKLRKLQQVVSSQYIYDLDYCIVLMEVRLSSI